MLALDGSAPAPPARRVLRRRPLPGGRAITGGFLVAASAVGLFAAYLHATSRASATYVVARHSVPAGQSLQSGDLSLVSVDLTTASIASHAFRATREVVGRVVLAPLTAGELVEDSMLASPGQSLAGRRVGIAVDATQLDAVQVGGWVDVLVTRGSSDASHTDVVVAGARLLDITRPRSSLGNSASPVAQLEVPSFDLVRSLVQAAHDGPITLVASSPPATP